ERRVEGGGGAGRRWETRAGVGGAGAFTAIAEGARLPAGRAQGVGASARARVMIPNTNCAAPELREAWRAVANAKLTEFRRQCWRLSMLVRRGTVDKQAAVDRLWEIAIAHALVRALGEDRIQAILDESFADVDFRPMASEVA